MSNKPKRPSMRPGMKRKKPKPRGYGGRVIWITQNPKPIESIYRFGDHFHELSQFGTMYRCQRKENKKIFVVNTISKATFYRLDHSTQRTQALLFAMQGEIDIMRHIMHKYIVSMQDVFEDKHKLYIIYNQYEGGTLLDRINIQQKHNLTVYGYIRSIEKTLNAQIIPNDIYILCYHYYFQHKHNVQRIIKQICEALHYMHYKFRMIHGDLRPETILFADNSMDAGIKIMDFGMSKVYSRMKPMRRLCHTSHYTAPEVINGDYCHAVDMWSVGIIAYLLLCGYPPFYNHSNNYYGKKETDELHKLILHGLTNDHEKILKENVSKDAMDFIMSLLETDVSKRLTSNEALHHPWLRNIVEMDIDIGHSMCMNLSFGDFERMQRIKCAISTLFADEWSNIKPVNLKELLRKFASFDGTITFSAFLDVSFNKDDIKRILIRFKIDELELELINMNKMEIESLINALIHDYMVNIDLRLYQHFREFDDDQDGKIKTKELKDKIVGMDPYDNIDEMFKIIDDYELDFDGIIDYGEFLMTLQPDLNVVPDWF